MKSWVNSSFSSTDLAELPGRRIGTGSTERPEPFSTQQNVQAEEEVREAHRDELKRLEACKRAARQEREAKIEMFRTIMQDMFNSVVDDMLCELRSECPAPDFVDMLRAAYRSSPWILTIV